MAGLFLITNRGGFELYFPERKPGIEAYVGSSSRKR